MTLVRTALPIRVVVASLLGVWCVATASAQTSGTQDGQDEAMVSDTMPPPAWGRNNRRVRELPRVTAKELLGQRPVAGTFAALQGVLEPGHQVVLVRPNASRIALRLGYGGVTSRVAEVSRERLILVRTHLFQQQEIVVGEADVRRIEIIDSKRNGALIGLAVGSAFGLVQILGAWHGTHENDCDLCPLGYLTGAAMAPLGAAIGADIDGRINQSIYERSPADRHVVVGPWFDREALGVAARFRF